MQFKYENIWFRNFIFFSLLSSATLIDMVSSEGYDLGRLSTGLLGILSFYLYTFYHNHFLLARYFLKKKFKRYFIFSLFYALVGAAILHYVVGYLIDQEESYHFISDLFSTTILLVFGSGLYFLHLWISDNLITSKKHALATERELATLKQQMNPHFLLNALNNLYGVALSNPDKVPDKIIELSDLLTYQIETSKKEWISLEEEISFAEKFLSYME
ncbi:MAG: histidine kinase [Chryseotalea sp.]|jgi:hypothetical protein